MLRPDTADWGECYSRGCGGCSFCIVGQVRQSAIITYVPSTSLLSCTIYDCTTRIQAINVHSSTLPKKPHRYAKTQPLQRAFLPPALSRPIQGELNGFLRIVPVVSTIRGCSLLAALPPPTIGLGPVILRAGERIWTACAEAISGSGDNYSAR